MQWCGVVSGSVGWVGLGGVIRGGVRWGGVVWGEHGLEGMVWDVVGWYGIGSGRCRKEQQLLESKPAGHKPAQVGLS